MDLSELTWRLKKLGVKKNELAAYLGLHVETVYHWKEVPAYAQAWIRQTERLMELGEKP